MHLDPIVLKRVLGMSKQQMPGKECGKTFQEDPEVGQRRILKSTFSTFSTQKGEDNRKVPVRLFQDQRSRKTGFEEENNNNNSNCINTWKVCNKVSIQNDRSDELEEESRSRIQWRKF